ncbi:hypothetical protein KLEB273_gp297 [Bacillus phage vB_BauM_KLEB27-3]|nr:hypothetical protein KLEB273_gp297 [Bacillus phage vB_BauM_KLEB27-3]
MKEFKKERIGNSWFVMKFKDGDYGLFAGPMFYEKDVDIMVSSLNHIAQEYKEKENESA